jgi:hypothetical protein
MEILANLVGKFPYRTADGRPAMPGRPILFYVHFWLPYISLFKNLMQQIQTPPIGHCSYGLAPNPSKTIM